MSFDLSSSCYSLNDNVEDAVGVTLTEVTIHMFTALTGVGWTNITAGYLVDGNITFGVYPMNSTTQLLNTWCSSPMSISTIPYAPISDIIYSVYDPSISTPFYHQTSPNCTDASFYYSYYQTIDYSAFPGSIYYSSG